MKSLLYFLSILPLTVSFCVKENNFLNYKNEAKTTLCCSSEEDNNLLDYSNVKEKENKNVCYNFLLKDSECSISYLNNGINDFNLISKELMVEISFNLVKDSSFTLYITNEKLNQEVTFYYSTYDYETYYLSNVSLSDSKSLQYKDLYENNIIDYEKYVNFSNKLYCDEEFNLEEKIEKENSQKGAKSLNYFYISGDLYWQSDIYNSVVEPLRFFEVEIYKIVLGLMYRINIVYTDEDGHFTSQYSGYDNLDSLQFTIKVKCKGEEGYGKFVDSSNEVVYYTFNAYNFDDVTHEVYIYKVFSISDSNEIVHIIQTTQYLIYCARGFRHYFYSHSTAINCSICYHNISNKSCYYKGSENKIYIKIAPSFIDSGNLSLAYYSQIDVISHEYGHHMQNVLGNIEDNPNGTHYIEWDNLDYYIEDNLYTYTEKMEKAQKIAWAEGSATYYGEALQHISSQFLMNDNYACDHSYTGVNFINYHSNGTSTLSVYDYEDDLSEGMEDELFIIKFLYFISIKNDFIEPCDLFDILVESDNCYTIDKFLYLIKNSNLINFDDINLFFNKMYSSSLLNVSGGITSSPYYYWNLRFSNVSKSDQTNNLRHRHFYTFTLSFYNSSSLLFTTAVSEQKNYTLSTSEWTQISSLNYYDVVISCYSNYEVIDLNTSNLVYSISKGPYSTSKIRIYNNHSHTYTYSYVDDMHCRATCVCGRTFVQNHVITNTFVIKKHTYGYCNNCGTLIDCTFTYDY